MCDLAETYGIYDYRSLPLKMVATFSAGLGENSRIIKKLRGDNVSTDTLLLGMIYDNITRVLVALEAVEDPKYITDILTGKEVEEKQSSFRTFDDAESFEAERARIVRNIHGRN